MPSAFAPFKASLQLVNERKAVPFNNESPETRLQCDAQAKKTGLGFFHFHCAKTLPLSHPRCYYISDMMPNDESPSMTPLTNFCPVEIQFPETLLWGSPDQVGFSRERLRGGGGGGGHMLLYYFLSFGDYPHSIKRSFLVDELVSCIPTLPHEYKEQLHLVIFEDSKCLLHKIDSRLLKLQAPNQAATVRCGSCQMILMYPYGAPSVKCAVCHYVTNVGSSNGRTSNPVNRAHGAANSSTVPSPASAAHSQSQTVVVENPMSFDESGKLVSNVVVGVTTEKK